MRVSSLPLRAVFLATSISITALACAPTSAFADDEARRAILDLRQQVKQLTDQSQNARFQLADQINSLQHEMTDMRGQMEKLRWEIEVNKRSSEDQSGGNTPQVGNPQEQAAFNSAMGLFRSGKYKESAAGFGGFLSDYPSSQLATEAKFYQGSSQYASKDYKGSIQNLQSLIQANPKDARAPDALLIVAASQIELNNTAGAKASLQKIVKDYPQSSAAETAKSRLKLLQ